MAWALQERDAKGADSSTKEGHLIPMRQGGSFDHASLRGISDYGGELPTLRAQGADCGGGSEALVTHALTGEGFDASEDGSGRATPIVAQTITKDMYRSGGAVAGNNDQGVRNCIIDPVAFTCKDHGSDAGEVSPTLRSMAHDGSHSNGGGQVAIAFDTTQITSKTNRSNPKSGDPCHTLAKGADAPCIAIQDARGLNKAQNGSGIKDDGSAYTVDTVATQAVAFQTRIARNGRGQPEEVCPALSGADAGETSDMRPCVAINAPTFQVRRLTVTECSRLMGFPDNYLDILYRGKPACDGPKYKALGNSIATNCLRWIGQRIQLIDSIPK